MDEDTRRALAGVLAQAAEGLGITAEQLLERDRCWDDAVFAAVFSNRELRELVAARLLGMREVRGALRGVGLAGGGAG